MTTTSKIVYTVPLLLSYKLYSPPPPPFSPTNVSISECVKDQLVTIPIIPRLLDTCVVNHYLIKTLNIGSPSFLDIFKIQGADNKLGQFLGLDI